MVLSPTGGALAKLLPLFRARPWWPVSDQGPSGGAGSALDDEVAALVWLLETRRWRPGKPDRSRTRSTNREFTAALAKVLVSAPPCCPCLVLAPGLLLGRRNWPTRSCSRAPKWEPHRPRGRWATASWTTPRRMLASHTEATEVGLLVTATSPAVRKSSASALKEVGRALKISKKSFISNVLAIWPGVGRPHNQGRDQHRTDAPITMADGTGDARRG